MTNKREIKCFRNVVSVLFMPAGQLARCMPARTDGILSSAVTDLSLNVKIKEQLTVLQSSKHGQILHRAFLVEGTVTTSSLHCRKTGPAASSHAGPRQRSLTRGLRVVVTALCGKRESFSANYLQIRFFVFTA